MMRIRLSGGLLLALLIGVGCSSSSGGGGGGGGDPADRALAYCSDANAKCGTAADVCPFEANIASVMVASGCPAEFDALYDCFEANAPTCGQYGPEPSPACTTAAEAAIGCVPFCEAVDVDFSQFACAGTKLSFQVECDCETMVCTCKGGPKSGWTFSGSDVSVCDIIGHDPIGMAIECT